MTRQLEIDGVRIDDGSDCYVIAEVGHNHQGDVEKAKEMFRQAKLAGANAVKLQKRDNRSLYAKALFDKPYDHENSFGKTYGAHREFLEFNMDQYRELQEFARSLGLTFFATAFDMPSADFLAKLDVPAFKLASGDLRNTPLLKHVARFGKPMIISTGGAEMADVDRAVRAIAPINKQLAILQCTAAYPANFHELNLAVIPAFRERFPDHVIGLSAHDNGIAIPVAAFVLGARIVEKHFTLNRAMKGTDHAFSLEPIGLSKMVRDLRRTRLAMGDGVKRPYPSEVAPLQKMGKKLVAARDLPAGHVLTATDVAVKSPGDGIAPFELDRVVGAKLKKPVKADDGFDFASLDGVAPALEARR